MKPGQLFANLRKLLSKIDCLALKQAPIVEEKLATFNQGSY